MAYAVSISFVISAEAHLIDSQGRLHPPSQRPPMMAGPKALPPATPPSLQAELRPRANVRTPQMAEQRCL
jgi:hypothetical protein